MIGDLRDGQDVAPGAWWGDPLLPEDPGAVGRYALIRRLTVGEHGPVYVGRAVSGLVAIRLLDPALVERHGGAGPVARSLALAAELPPSSGVAPVVETQLSGDQWYVVTALTQGRTLQEFVDQQGPLPAEALLRVAELTTAALVALHDAGLAHGDVHPRTVMLDHGRARLVGGLLPAGPQPFGPAIPTTAQLDDVRAWATTMAFAVSGRDSFLTLDHRASGGWLDPDGPAGAATLALFPAPLASLVRSCLVVDPIHRPSARQLLDQLRRVANTIPEGLTVPAPVMEPAVPPSPLLPAWPMTPMTPVSQPFPAVRVAHEPRADSRPGRRGPRTPLRRRIAFTGAVGALAGLALGVGTVSAAELTGFRTGTSRTAPHAAELAVALPTQAGSGAVVRGTCTATFDVVETWPGGFKAEVTIVAGARGRVDGWQVGWTAGRSQSIRQSWDATLERRGNGVLAHSIERNRQLSAGQQARFGFVVDGPVGSPPAPITCTPR